VAQPKALVSLIVAMSRNGVIGLEGRLPWHIPAELQRFKTLTMGHPIVMGRKTWDSIGRLLPGRTTIIVSRNPGLRVEGAHIASSLEQALDLARPDPEAFVIGGAEIFRLSLPYAGRIYLTTVAIDCAGDTFMPSIDWTQWRRTARESHPAQGDTPGWALTVCERLEAAKPTQ
jgi:dihydrofolate reductase